MEAERHTLTQIQINFVKFLGERSISDNEIRDIKKLISLYFVAKADAKMNEIWEEKTFSEQKMLQILNTVL